METMTAAFSARPSVQLDNMIVYSGPPAAKNQKIRFSRPALTSQARDDPLPPAAIRTGRAGIIENGRDSTTSHDHRCNGFTSTIAQLASYEAASCSVPLVTPTPTETDDYRSIAGVSFGSAMRPDIWGDMANSMCIPTAAGSGCNESTHPAFCSTIDVRPACTRTMSSAAAPADPRQCTRDNIECTSLGSSPSPVGVSRSPSPAVMHSHAYRANSAVPVSGSIPRDRTSELVRTVHHDEPFPVHSAVRDFSEEMSSVCVALEAQPHQSNTLVGRDLQDEHWVHDQDAVTGDDATLVLAGDHSCSASDQENSLHHETIRAGRDATIAKRTGSACEENSTCDSSDEDIVPWIPKRRRAPPRVGSESAEERDPDEPSTRRQRRQTHTAEPAGTSSLCRRAGSQVSSGPASRFKALSRSRRSTNTTSASPIIQQDESCPSPALEVDDQPTWEVHRIVGSVRKHGKVFYKVQWKPTWEPAASLQGSADAALEEFRSSNKYRRTK